MIDVGQDSKNVQFKALKELNLALKKNEILGIIGPNGAGKSTIFNVLGSRVPLDAGKLTLGGCSVLNKSQNGGLSGKVETKKYDDFFLNVGICMQEDVFWGDLTIQAHFELIS